MRHIMAAAALPLVAGVTAVGADFSAIFHNVGGVSGSAVPGIPGAAFGPGTGTTHFDRNFGSGNGNWTLTADSDLATTEDELLIVNGVVVGREGTPAPWAPGENYGLLDTRVPINNAGQFAFATNTSATTADDYIIRGNGVGGFNIVAREGDPVPGMPGIAWGATLDTAVITADGRVGFAGQMSGGGLTTTNDDGLFLDTTMLAQEAVTVPGGQAGTPAAWDEFDIDNFWVSSDGSTWMVRGDTLASTSEDDVVAVNNFVVLQEGQTIAGMAAPIALSGIDGTFMDESGNWYARGNNTDGDDWVVRNGVVVAQKGGSIDGGSETWSDATFGDLFFLHVGNSLGDYVIGGVSDNPDPLRDGVLVLNGTTVVARQGDPVDLDGNGLFDDDAFFDTFGNDDAVLTDDLTLHVVATFMNGAGTRIGQGVFVARIPEPASILLLAAPLALIRRRS